MSNSVREAAILRLGSEIATAQVCRDRLTSVANHETLRDRHTYEVCRLNEEIAVKSYLLNLAGSP